MSSEKKKWLVPSLEVLGDMRSLTQAPGPPCTPPVQKGHGTGDTFSNSQINNPNPNNGCSSGL